MRAPCGFTTICGGSTSKRRYILAVDPLAGDSPFAQSSAVSSATAVRAGPPLFPGRFNACGVFPLRAVRVRPHAPMRRPARRCESRGYVFAGEPLGCSSRQPETSIRRLVPRTMVGVLIRPLAEVDFDAWWRIRLRMLQEHPEAFGSSYEETLAEGGNAASARRAVSRSPSWPGGRRRFASASAARPRRFGRPRSSDGRRGADVGRPRARPGCGDLLGPDDARAGVRRHDRRRPHPRPTGPRGACPAV